jgi:hypothetical protein
MTTVIGQPDGQRARCAQHCRAAVVPPSTSYAVSEAVGVEQSVGKRFGGAKLFVGLSTGQIVIGAAVALIPGNLIQLLVQAKVLNGVITPTVLTWDGRREAWAGSP